MLLTDEDRALLRTLLTEHIGASLADPDDTHRYPLISVTGCSRRSKVQGS
jgi:hypothetical protein